MALFPKDEGATAPERMAFTREAGTRRLLLLVVTIIAVWWGAGRLNDRRLLSQKWEPLQPQEGRLVVVGTLDARGEYDRNLFRIVQANQTSRVELTDYGWNRLFADGKGEMYREGVASAIESALKLDNRTGYAMLEPYLREAAAKAAGRAPTPITPDTQIAVIEGKRGAEVPAQRKLSDLVARFSADREGPDAADDAGAGGSASGKEVEHGVAIPGDVLVRACPVVLTADSFAGGSYEQMPQNILQRRAYRVHLDLTPEGRSRFYQWTRDHENESLVFVVGEEVVTAARVRQALNVSDYQIENVPDEATAKKLIDAVKK